MTPSARPYDRSMSERSRSSVVNDQDLARRIAVAWRDLRRMKTQPLSVPMPQGQLDTMDVLAQMGPCTMAELSTALAIDASTATRAVERLVQVGLVERNRSAEDGRTVLVYLTTEGRALEKKLTVERMRIMKRALAGLTPEDLEEIATSMERLLSASRRINWAED